MVKRLLTLAALAVVLTGCASVRADIERIADVLAHDASPKRVHPLDSAKNLKAVVLDPAVEEARGALEKAIK